MYMARKSLSGTFTFIIVCVYLDFFEASLELWRDKNNRAKTTKSITYNQHNRCQRLSRLWKKQSQLFTVTGPAFSYKLRYIVGFGLVEMAISTNPKPTIYRNLYGNAGPVHSAFGSIIIIEQSETIEL